MELEQTWDPSGTTKILPPQDSNRKLYNLIGQWQTRILKLYPESAGEPIKGDLLVADLVHLDGVVLHEEQLHIDYEAISYSWGWPALTGSIVVNGIRHGIPPPMEAALKRFRYHDDVRYLWADALCIDQSNTEEKSMQVRYIFTIYRKAKRTIVWLGEAGEDTVLALAKLTAELMAQNTTRPEIFEADAALSDAIVEFLDQSGTGSEIAPVLKEICCRPWVGRVWVQQEIFVSKTALVYCGVCEIPYRLYRVLGHALLSSSFLDARERELLDLLSSLGPVGAELVSELEHNRTFPSRRPGNGTCTCDYDEEPDSTLLNRWRHSTRPECILRMALNLKSSDIKDRVYALLSMTDCKVTSSKPKEEGSLAAFDTGDGNVTLPPTFQIDYARSASRIFQDITKYIMNRDLDLDILRYHCPTLTQSSDLELPSWTPDWRRLVRHENIDSQLEFRSRFIDWQLEDDVGILKVRCVRLGTVLERTVSTSMMSRQLDVAKIVRGTKSVDIPLPEDQPFSLALLAKERRRRELEEHGRHRVLTQYPNPSDSLATVACTIPCSPTEEGRSSQYRTQVHVSDTQQRMQQESISESPTENIQFHLRTWSDAQPGDLLVKVDGADWLVFIRPLRAYDEATDFSFVGAVEQSGESRLLTMMEKAAFDKRHGRDIEVPLPLFFPSYESEKIVLL